LSIFKNGFKKPIKSWFFYFYASTHAQIFLSIERFI
jgi:hypothetical protein